MPPRPLTRHRLIGAAFVVAATAVGTAVGGQAAGAASGKDPGPAGPPVPAAVVPMLAHKNCFSGGPNALDSLISDYAGPKMHGSRLNSLNDGRASCARAIVNTVKDRSLPERAAVIAVTTAITESTLQDYTALSSDGYHSLGLFQQRPAWGTPAQRTDPVHSTNSFINTMLRKYPNGGWKTADIGAVCQKVQGSALPAAYDKEAHDAQMIANLLWTSGPSGWVVSTGAKLRIMRAGSAGYVYEKGTALRKSSWASWTSIHSGSESLTGTPAIIYRHHRQDVFAVGSNGRIWHRIYKNGSWNTWTALTTADGNPVVAKEGTGVSAAYGHGQQQLFYVSPGNHVYRTYYDDGWHSRSLGGDYRGTPGVIMIGDRTDVYATDVDGYIDHTVRHQGGSWGSWVKVKSTAGTRAQAKVGTGVATIHADGCDRLFYIAPDNHVNVTSYDDGWVTHGLGGNYRGVPAIVFDGNQIDLFAAGAGGNVYHRRRMYGGSFSPWTRIGDNP